MTKKINNVFIVMFIVLICGIAAGTFVDLDVAKAVFVKDNGFSAFCESLTPLVLGNILAIGGTLTFWTNNFEKKATSVLKYILTTLGYISGVAFGGLLAFGYTGIVGIVVVVAVAIVTALLVRKQDAELKSKLQKVGYVIVLSMTFGSLVVETIKPIVGRVRFRSMNGNYELFTAWYSINGKTYIDFVPKAEELKSFPSGHSQWAMMTVCLGLAVNALPKYKKYAPAVMAVSFVYILVMMFSRMAQGAHFLSDVCTGGLIQLTIIFIWSKVFIKNNIE